MAEIYGTQGDDTLTGAGDDDYIFGYEGDDTLSGLGGNDVLAPGGGMDVVDGGAGDDRIFIGEADGAVDTLTGGAGADRFEFQTSLSVSTLIAIDRITDFSAAEGDQLHIGVISRPLRWAGAVSTPGFSLSAGQSLAGGGSGLADVWTWSDAGSTWLIIDLNGDQTLDDFDFVVAFDGAPALGVGSFRTGTFVQSGTHGVDSFTGTGNPDVYYALDGDDTAYGAGGGDDIYGGAGRDNLIGGDGDDLLVGETGDDILHGGIGDDWLYAGMRNYTSLYDVGATNELYGEAGDDILFGGGGRDLLEGGDGADYLDSREDDSSVGGDSLYGGDGNDGLRFSGDAVVDGGAGDDVFFFGEVGSNVSGGAGADRFDLMLSIFDDSFAAGRFHLITDFNQSEGDRLNFGSQDLYRQPLIFRGGLDNPDFSLQAGQSFSSSSVYGSDLTQIWTWASGGETLLIADLDDSGTLTGADYVLRFSGAIVLTHDAFVPDAVIANPGGTAGADVIQGADSSDVIYGLSGDDIIHAGAGNDTIFGGAGDDEIYGGADSNYLYGGDGDDVLTGGAGYNVIHGGSGSDIIHGGAGGGQLNAGGNHPGDVDTIDDMNLIYGSELRDLIWGGLGPLDQSFGNGGNDIISGGGLLEGGDGDDQLSSNGALAATILDGGDGHDTINSGAFGDLIIGGVGKDGLRGEGGDDEILGAFGDHTMDGGDGDDVLRISGQAAEGDPTLYIRGGIGSDVADFSEAAGYLTLGLGAPGEQETGLGRVYIEGVEHIIAAAAGSHITGSQGADFIEGRAGADTLLGGAGHDSLLGGAGDDMITGGLGNDRIDGGLGEDVLHVSGVAADYRLLMDGDDFVLKGPDGGDHLTGVETIRFSDGRVLELNRMYVPGPDGAIAEALLSPAPAEEPLVLPPPVQGKPADDDAFVLPPLSDDQPLVLPGLEALKFGEEPLVLPGIESAPSPFLGLEARLARTDDWTISLNPENGLMSEPALRHDDWIG